MTSILRAWLDDVSWNTALWLDDHDRPRAAARYWHHRRHSAVPNMLPAAIVLPFTTHPLWALPAVALLLLVQAGAGHLADRTHAIGLDDADPCPRCPHDSNEDDDGRGGRGPGDHPDNGPLDPFTADDVARLDALYRMEITR